MNKELQRVQRESLQTLDGKGVIKMFPARLASRHTALVLKELFGDEYTDYDLVFCSPSPMGTPIEWQVINRALNKLIKDNDLTKVVFHNLRHSSITYKLKLNDGDMKSVQGDSGQGGTAPEEGQAGLTVED